MSTQPTRRTSLKFAAVSAVALPTLLNSDILFAQQTQEVTPVNENGINWYDVSQWEIEGKGWPDTLKPFDRLPPQAEKMVPISVWNLSRHSAGMRTNFSSNSNEIRVRYQLSNPNLAMSHMPATGVSGVDLYADDNGQSRWVNVSRPEKASVNTVLARGIDLLENGAARNFSLYLPLYNGVEKLEIGVPEKFSFLPVLARKQPILFYGTSIMHGACASRPGMSISAILGRRFKRPVTNLGFSGSGKMEIELAELIGMLTSSVIAIDCLPNMNATLVKERAVPFVRKLRELQPDIPIVLVEDRAFTNSRFFRSKRNHHQASRAELKKAFDQLVGGGMKGLSYLEGKNLLGDDGDGATDGSHPNDLGMMRYADAYEQVLRTIL